MANNMCPQDFIALILTHGRAENVVTYKALRSHGYTGPIALVVDDEDDQYEKYVQIYGDEVVQFHKAGVVCDTYDNRQERRVILFARNVSFDVAKKLGYRYFIELDDDYTLFTTRFDREGNFKGKKQTDLNAVFCAMVDFLRECKSVSTIAMAQGGDYVGGGNANRSSKIQMWRKAMNSFICDTERRFDFRGRINEDVNTYTLLGSQGALFFTHNLVCLHQVETQKSKGGMTGAYVDGGTYVKSFYSVISMPSAVKVGVMGNKNMRLHHLVDWRHCVPMIMREEYKK